MSKQVKQNLTKRPIDPFGGRLHDAFNGASTQEIADLLGVKYHAARNYLNGRVPDAGLLIKISNLTNCNIHWLLTNEGPQKNIHGGVQSEGVHSDVFGKYADEIFLSNYLDEELQVKIRQLANERNMEVGEILAELVRDGFLVLDIENILQHYGYRREDTKSEPIARKVSVSNKGKARRAK